MITSISRLLLLILCCVSTFSFAQQDEPEAFYLANEGVMVTDSDTKILFDPLFPDSY